MFRKLSISKTVDAMVTEKVGVGRAKVPGYSIQNQNGLAISMKNAVQVAGNLFTLCYKILSVTMKEQLPGEVCMN